MPGLYSTETSDVDMVSLRRIKASFTRLIPEDTYVSGNLRLIMEDQLGKTAYKLATYLLAEKFPPAKISEHKDVSFWWPASPWQFFKQLHKESWWLGWLVRRRPVRSIKSTQRVLFTADLTRYHKYPQAKALPPEYGEPVRGYDLIVRTTVHPWGEE